MSWTTDAANWFRQASSPFYDGNSPLVPRQEGSVAIPLNIGLSDAGRLGFFIDYSERTSAGTHTFYVARTHGTTGAVSVNFQTGGDAHSTTTGILNWADGDASIQSFTVDVSASNLSTHEANGLGEHRIWALLSSPTNGAVLHFEAEHTRAYGVIDTGAIASDANAIFYDAQAGVNGTGTQANPYNSLDDAIANVSSKRYLYGKGTTTRTAQIAAPTTRTDESNRLYVRNWPSNTWLIQGGGSSGRGFYANAGESFCTYRGIDFADFDTGSGGVNVCAVFYHYNDSASINIEHCTANRLNGHAGGNNGAFMLWGVNGGKVWRCSGDTISTDGLTTNQNTALVYSYRGVNLSVQRCEASSMYNLLYHKQPPYELFKASTSVRFCVADNVQVHYGRIGSGGEPHSYTIAQCNLFKGTSAKLDHLVGTLGLNGSDNAEKHWWCNNTFYQVASGTNSPVGLYQNYKAAVFNNIFFECRRLWAETVDSSAYGSPIEYADFNVDYGTTLTTQRYEWKDVLYETAAALNTANAAFAANDSQTNPLFTNAAAGDFTLQAGSPVLTGGVGGTQQGAYLGDFYTIGAN